MAADLTIIGVALTSVTGLVVALKMVLDRKNQPPQIPPVAPPSIDFKNGMKELFESKVSALRELIQHDLNDQENRVTRHKEDIIKEIDNVIRRMDSHYRKIEELQKQVTIIETKIELLAK